MKGIDGWVALKNISLIIKPEKCSLHYGLPKSGSLENVPFA